jgi:hypothetical protein
VYVLATVMTSRYSRSILSSILQGKPPYTENGTQYPGLVYSELNTLLDASGQFWGSATRPRARGAPPCVDGEREMVLMRWGMPPPSPAGHEHPHRRAATARCGFTIMPDGLVKLPQRKGARRSLNL